MVSQVQCEKCRYWRPIGGTGSQPVCHYLLDNRISRSQAGDNCLSFRARMRGHYWDTERAQQLKAEGMTYRQIAKALDVRSISTVGGYFARKLKQEKNGVRTH